MKNSITLCNLSLVTAKMTYMLEFDRTYSIKEIEDLKTF